MIVSKLAYSQNLTFDQVQSLRQKDLTELEIFLTKMGWKMTEAEGATDKTMGHATFGYEVNRFDSKKAVAWITFYESKIKTKYNRLGIQISKPQLYSTYLTRLTANGYKLVTSKIIDGGIEKIYQNSTTTIIVTTSTSEGSFTKNTTYDFFFIDNLSYLDRIKNEE